MQRDRLVKVGAHTGGYSEAQCGEDELCVVQVVLQVASSTGDGGNMLSQVRDIPSDGQKHALTRNTVTTTWQRQMANRCIPQKATEGAVQLGAQCVFMASKK